MGAVTKTSILFSFRAFTAAFNDVMANSPASFVACPYSKLKLVVKFGEAYNDEDDEILIIPHGEHQFNIAQYIYEMLVLVVPQKRVHPGVEDGTLQSDILDKLEELQPKENTKPSEDTDPRWDDLKKLLTDK